MSTTAIDVKDLPTHFDEVLRQASSGIEVIVTEGNTPRARLVPLAGGQTPRRAGLHPGMIQMSDDFDAPLPDEFWLGKS